MSSTSNTEQAKFK